MSPRQRGVTLLELLVALAIFAIVGIAAYASLFSVLDARETTQRRADRLAEVQYGVGALADDFRQLVDRGVRASQPAARLPLTTEPERPGVFALTRGGWANPAGLDRSTLARVRWQLEGDRLLRIAHRHLDGVIGEEDPLVRVMLERVEAVEVRFRGEGEEWHERWPPLNVPPGNAGMPRAVQITLELADWGRVVRLFDLPRRAPAGPPEAP